MVKNFQKILLILPPVKAGTIIRSNNVGILPPLMLLALANYVKGKSSRIKILDGQILDLNAMLRYIKMYCPEMVGISPTLATYNNGLILARLAKSLGAKVILGGHYAASLASAILQSRGPYSKDYCIDAICRQDGEEAFRQLIEGRPNNQIPNLVWMDDGRLKFNEAINLDLNDLPFLDFSSVNLGDYYQERADNDKNGLFFSKVLAIYSRKGCRWRQISKGGCVFCSITYQKVRLKNPKRFWAETDFLHERFKPNYIWDVADDFLDNPGWFREFSRLGRRQKTIPQFLIYARSDRITGKITPILKKLNVAAVFLGLESGDNRMLRYLRKGITPEDNRRAVKLLAKAGIKIVANFIFGGMGESKKTLNSNLDFMRFLKEESPDVILQPHPFVVIPGSQAWQILLKKTGRKYMNQDNPDSNELLGDWLKYFTRVTPKDVQNAFEKAKNFLLPSQFYNF